MTIIFKSESHFVSRMRPAQKVTCYIDLFTVINNVDLDVEGNCRTSRDLWHPTVNVVPPSYDPVPVPFDNAFHT